MDITKSILDQHHQLRELFARLDDVDRSDTGALESAWRDISSLLEVHAEAEERFFYPTLLEIGTGASDADSAKDETKDAIKDHNKIRDKCAEANAEEVGSDAWFKAVSGAREENSEHMAEEERQALADFRRHADDDTRHRLALEFQKFCDKNRAGAEYPDKDPKEYIESGGDVAAAEQDS